jgi:hypothetical protein
MAADPPIARIAINAETDNARESLAFKSGIPELDAVRSLRLSKSPTSDDLACFCFVS